MLKPKDLLEHLEKIAYSDDMLEPRMTHALYTGDMASLQHFYVDDPRSLSYHAQQQEPRSLYNQRTLAG